MLKNFSSKIFMLNMGLFINIPMLLLNNKIQLWKESINISYVKASDFFAKLHNFPRQHY